MFKADHLIDLLSLARIAAIPANAQQYDCTLKMMPLEITHANLLQKITSFPG